MFLDVAWEGTGQLNSRTSDISLGGCFVDSVGHVAEGEKIRFRIRLPDGEWVQIGAVVAYTHPNIGFGVRFVDVTEDVFSKLKQLIDNLNQPT